MAQILQKFGQLSAAKLQKKSATQRYKADTKHTKIKNNDHFNLSLYPLWFPGVFVFEDFLPIKQRFGS
jgi:hypothetical protein